MKKKVKFGTLKPGQKIFYKRKLYLVDNCPCPVRLSDGEINPADAAIDDDTLVTPVKLNIRVL